MRKDNYAYFTTTNGEPRDIGAKLLEKCNKLPKFQNLQKGLVKEIRKGQQYHLALPIESEIQDYSLSSPIKWIIRKITPRVKRIFETIY